MSADCGICKLECVRDGSEVMCDGGCLGFFHATCVKADKERKKTRGGSYKCINCRVQMSGQTPGTPDADLKDFINKVMVALKNEFSEGLNNLKKEINDLGGSMQFLSDQMDTASSLMKAVKEELSQVKKENAELREKNASLSNEMMDMKERVRNLERYSRKCNIEISGIPETPNEDVLRIVRDVGAAVGVEVDETQITAAHRIPSYKKERIPSLVVQFLKKSQKDSWVNKYREVKTLTARQVNNLYPNNKVYINDHLCPEDKLFLNKLKSKCQEVGYKFAWCREGKFFVRKDQGEKCLRVTTCSDIDKLK